MKRSEINSAVDWAIRLLEKNNFKLPHFAYWDMETWKENKAGIDVIRRVMLGWDITDYGQGNFEKLGTVLYTIRNGDVTDSSVGTTHYHVKKTEDIINRGGGVLALKLYNSNMDGTLDVKNDVVVYMDGIRNVVRPDETLLVYPGNSMTITPYMYHKFWAFEGKGDLIVGEVSSINDDNTDNYFLEKCPRFSNIEEDEMVKYPLCNEYAKVIK
jgi:D-lyxose ketol-isomerase